MQNQKVNPSFHPKRNLEILHRRKIFIEGHTSYIHSLCISPDHKYLASGSSDKTLRLWSISKNRLKAIFEGHYSRVNIVKFFDSSCIVSASDDLTIRLWHTKKHNEDNIIRKNLEVTCLDTCSKTRNLYFGSALGDIFALNIDTKEMLFEIQENIHFFSIFLDKKNSFLVSNSSYKIKIWRLEEKNAIKHEEIFMKITSAAYDLESSKIYFSSEDRKILSLDVKLLQICIEFEIFWIHVLCMIVVNNLNILACGTSDGSVILFDLKEFTVKYELQCHISWVNDLAYSSLSNCIYSCSDDKLLKWLNLDSKNTSEFNTHSSWVSCVVEYDNFLVSGSNDLTVRIWDTSKKSLKNIFRGHKKLITSLCVISDKCIISGSLDGTARIWRH